MFCPQCRPIKIKLINSVGNIWCCPMCDYLTTHRMYVLTYGEDKDEGKHQNISPS